MANLSMRRMWLNLLLLFVVAGLAGLVWWQLQQKEQQAQSTRLLPFGLADVSSVAIERKDEAPSTLEFKREGENWSLTQPVKVAANEIKLRQLLTLLDEKVESSYPSANKDLSAYGLAPANLSVRFNDKTLVLGESNPVSNFRYILNGEQIQLVNEAVYSLAQEDWVNFVALKLVPDEFQLTAVQLPEGFADSPTLVSAWKSAEAIRVKRFEAEDIKPEMQKLILKSASTTRELLIASLQDELVFADPTRQLAYVLPISQAAQLLPTKTGLEPAKPVN